MAMVTCPLHSGVEAKLEGICKKVDLQFAAQEKALEKATREMDRRLEGMNEFRKQLEMQANLFATRTELRAESEKLDLKIGPLLRCAALTEGSTKWSDYLIMVVISAIVVALAKLIHL